jgi:hypothetical protein
MQTAVAMAGPAVSEESLILDSRNEPALMHFPYSGKFF